MPIYRELERYLSPDITRFTVGRAGIPQEDGQNTSSPGIKVAILAKVAILVFIRDSVKNVNFRHFCPILSRMHLNRLKTRPVFPGYSCPAG